VGSSSTARSGTFCTCSGRIAVAIAQRWLDRIQVLPAYHTAVVLVSEMVISKMLKEKLYG
jgi:hypothetical protein